MSVQAARRDGNELGEQREATLARPDALLLHLALDAADQGRDLGEEHLVRVVVPGLRLHQVVGRPRDDAGHGRDARDLLQHGRVDVENVYLDVFFAFLEP